MTSILTSCKKSVFQDFLTINALEINFELVSNLGSSLPQLGRAHVHKCYIISSNSLAFLFLRGDFYGFYHMLDWRPSGSCGQDHFVQTFVPHTNKSPYEIKKYN